MTAPLVVVVVPTIDGREDHFARCVASYEAQHGDDLRVHIMEVRNRPTCGIAWQAAADMLQEPWHRDALKREPDYLHLTADDLEAAPGALLAAVEACSKGYLPAPHVLSADGRTQSIGGDGDGMLWTAAEDGQLTQWCAVPFLPWSAWGDVGPMVPLHYYTDDWFTHRSQARGFEFRVCERYRFRHYDALPGRGAGMSQHERAAVDRRDFARYLSGELTP